MDRFPFVIDYIVTQQVAAGSHAIISSKSFVTALRKKS